MMRLPGTNVAAGWGNRAQLGSTMELLRDVQSGNRDGIAGNEGRPAGDVGTAFERNPLVRRLQNAAQVGLSTRDEVATLKAFVDTKEAQWGAPVIAPDVLTKMRNGSLFAAQKAIQLTRLSRHPNDVVDGFVDAAGSVAGEKIAPRRLHFQQWAPLGPPSGRVVVISPGYQETGRTFEDQIQKLSAKGHTVIAMDHQWAGQSDGQPGGIDSGAGVARDVAAMAAKAAQIAEQQFGSDGTVMLLGNSMGAGPGVLGAVLLNDNGQISLDGPQMPKGLDVVLQSPFLGATKNLTNILLQGFGSVPMVNRMQLPSMGLPDLSDDRRTEQLSAQGGVQEDVRAQLKAFSVVQPHIDMLFDRLRAGDRPQGHVSIVGNAGDTLADSAQWSALKDIMGDGVTLQTWAGTDHVMPQALDQQDRALDALDALINK